MTPYDLTSAAAGQHVQELRDHACAARMAARAACSRAYRTPSAADRLRARLGFPRSTDACR